jgi:hypothetical protein
MTSTYRVLYHVPTTSDIMDTRFIHSVLGDLQYPTEKDEILLHAKLKGVGEDMYELLLRLPYKQYGSCRDIVAALPLQEFEVRIYQYL